MSSPTPAGPSVPKEKKGVSKLLSRMKTVLKKGEAAASSRRLSLLGSSKSTSKKPETAPVEDPATAPLARQPEQQEGVTRVTRVQLFEERAKQLGERFGLKIEPSEWHKAEGDALRVEKPIRMRVRRTCHKCDATFGVAKECPNCGHARCTKCIRHPPKRTEEEKQASRERWAARQLIAKENPPLVADWRPYDEKDIVLKRPARPAGGNEVVFRKPRQRVRRTCHECSTLFATGSKTCANCEHIRCTDCPRDPPKKDKYPYGYPGDVFGPNSIPHHECHECKTRYVGGAADGTECVKCKHPKCDKCPRLEPRKVDPEPDPEVLKSVQAKLAAISVS